jgi:hypothetical protein
MMTDGHDSVVQQLADDLGWLEAYSRQRPDQAARAAELRLAAALVRNCIGPYLQRRPAEPLHVAVVGGAGAGKSTVANLLTGAAAAETNPQAGFTRHPIGYASPNGTPEAPDAAGLLGPLRFLAAPASADLDEDVYQVRRVPAAEGFDLLKRFVVWDCPDMTTWAAAGYAGRLLEVGGLADVIVYVASDERYNDEVPTQYLRLFMQAGKPVVVCLTKMRPENTSALVAHFQEEVLRRMPGASVPCLAVPHLSPEQLADPARHAAAYRIPLVNQVAVLGEPAPAARQRSVRWASTYLTAAHDRLLGVARNDLAALKEWRRMVEEGRAEFDRRYRREYLSGEKFNRFDEALVRLLDLLELPGAGRVLSQALRVIRTPYRVIKSMAVKALSRPNAPALPEQPLLEEALAGWLDLLRKEAARRADTHPVWEHIEKGFSGGLGDQARERFRQGLGGFRLGLADEVDRTARAIYEDLEKNPAVLNTLRGGKFTLDAAAIAAAVAAGGINWGDLILVPLAASISHHLVEFMGKKYVDAQREQARGRQLALVTRHVSEPLAEWLAQWPTTGGSAYERLNLILRRVPEAVRRLGQAVQGGSVVRDQGR